MNENNFYQMLQPPDPTPSNEICSCCPETPVKLMSPLGYNPIHCVVCNLEVAPERLILNKDIVQSIAYWRNLYDAIHWLELDSGAYEAWAKRELCDINSPINARGLKTQRELNKIHKCYYWYFQDESDDEYVPFAICPVCNEPLQEYPEGIFKQRFCEKCGIIGAGE
jgi:predicted  nucleic acid-binding Zn ribbon protein